MTTQAAEQSTSVKGNAHPAFSWIRSERIESLKGSIPQAELDGLVADGSGLSPADVLAMLAE